MTINPGRRASDTATFGVYSRTGTAGGFDLSFDEDGGTVWRANGIVNGVETHRVTGRQFTVDYDNFVQRGLVRPGLNVLGFELGEGPPGSLISVEILPSTSIERTALGPPRLALDVAVKAKGGTPKGRSIRLRYTVRQTEGIPAKKTFLAVTYPDDGLKRTWADESAGVGDSTISVTLDTSGRASGELEFEGIRAGVWQVGVHAGAANADNRPGGSVSVEVAPSHVGSYLWPAILFAAAAGVLVLVSIRGARRRKRRASQYE